MNKHVILKLKNISLKVGKNQNQEILKNINLEIYNAEIFGITGESGSGKSTLAKVIAGLERQTTGEKFIHNESYSGIDEKHRIQLLFQDYSASHDPLQKIDSAFNELLKIKKVNPHELFKRKKEILNLVGLSDEILGYYPSQLSGGQLQRLALVKLLLLNPEILILDEPFASQDVVAVVNLIKILTQINQKFKTTIICISHDIPYLIKFCNRIGVMKNGELVDTLIIEKINNKVKIQNYYSDYTSFLLKSFEVLV